MQDRILRSEQGGGFLIVTVFQFLYIEVLNFYSGTLAVRLSMMSRMIHVGNNFWNLRSSFTFAMGTVDVGNQMSFIKLSTGKFLVIDTCAMNKTDEAIVKDMLKNGELIEAVKFQPSIRIYLIINL